MMAPWVGSRMRAIRMPTRPARASTHVARRHVTSVAQVQVAELQANACAAAHPGIDRDARFENAREPRDDRQAKSDAIHRWKVRSVDAVELLEDLAELPGSDA